MRRGRLYTRLQPKQEKIVKGKQKQQQQQKGQEQEQEEERPWQHALSLKDRLGLTDDEVVRLQASRRTGLGSARRLEERLTSRSAGGPKTGIGYLLGELRMKPEEVRYTLNRSCELGVLGAKELSFLPLFPPLQRFPLNLFSFS